MALNSPNAPGSSVVTVVDTKLLKTFAGSTQFKLRGTEVAFVVSGLSVLNIRAALSESRSLTIVERGFNLPLRGVQGLQGDLGDSSRNLLVLNYAACRDLATL